MNHDSAPPSTPTVRPAAYGAALAAMLLLAAALIGRAASPPERLLTSLQWFDVAIVQIACALPFAWWLGVWSGRMRRASRLLLTSLAFAAAAIVATTTVTSPPEAWLGESVVLTTLVVLTAGCCVTLIVGLSNESARVAFSTFTAISMLMVAYIVPATYLHARLRNAEIQLTDFLDQSRFGEALVVARPVARLEPQAVINGRPIRDVLATLAKGVTTLESQANAPLPLNATDELLLTRARQLAMLGRTEEALAILGDCREPGIAGSMLEGAIRETRSEWEQGRQKYQAARQSIEAMADGTTKTQQLAQAIKGVAYCERKAGRSREAEAAYLELLGIAPTADAHFLVAQFYEDAQSTSQALQHARQAMALDPQRFNDSGRKLINRLQTVHFGCWGVFTGGRASSSP